MREGIIWTNDGLVYWRMYALVGLDDLNIYAVYWQQFPALLSTMAQCNVRKDVENTHIPHCPRFQTETDIKEYDIARALRLMVALTC